jgi:hypothetical protein
MFSLIVTIMAIALVAALALATLYYGGAAFNVSADRATATSLINQGEQLIAAATLYRIDKGVAPASLSALVAEGYLQSVPVPPTGVSHAQNEFSLVSSAYAAEVTWTWDEPTETLSLVREVSNQSVCSQVNSVSYNMKAIVDKVDTSVRVQCYGDAAPYTVIWSARTGSAVADQVNGQAALCAATVDIGHIPAECGAGVSLAGSPGTGGSGTGTSGSGTTPPAAGGNSSGLKVAVAGSSAFSGQAYSVTGETKLVTVTNTTGETLYLTYSDSVMLWDKLDFDWSGTTCPDYDDFAAGATCTIGIKHPINYYAAAATEQLDVVGAKPDGSKITSSASFTVGDSWLATSVMTMTAGATTTVQVPYAPYRNPDMWGVMDGAYTGTHYALKVYSYPSPHSGTWSMGRIQVGTCAMRSGAGAVGPDWYETTCSINAGTPPGTYQATHYSDYTTCGTPSNPQGCSDTDYGWFKVQVN